MVECANIECKHRWLHNICIGLTEVPDGEWLCDDCTSSNGSLWCVCRRKKDEETMECGAKEHCTRGRHFHLSCVGYVPELQRGKIY